MSNDAVPVRRFLTVEQVAEELNSVPVVRSLLKSGELRGLQIGGRGLWRIGAVDLEDYISDAYSRTAERIQADDLTGEGAADDHEGAGERSNPRTWGTCGGCRLEATRR